MGVVVRSHDLDRITIGEDETSTDARGYLRAVAPVQLGNDGVQRGRHLLDHQTVPARTVLQIETAVVRGLLPTDQAHGHEIRVAAAGESVLEVTEPDALQFHRCFAVVTQRRLDSAVVCGDEHVRNAKPGVARERDASIAVLVLVQVYGELAAKSWTELQDRPPAVSPKFIRQFSGSGVQIARRVPQVPAGRDQHTRTPRGLEAAQRFLDEGSDVIPPRPVPGWQDAREGEVTLNRGAAAAASPRTGNQPTGARNSGEGEERAPAQPAALALGRTGG